MMILKIFYLVQQTILIPKSKKKNNPESLTSIRSVRIADHKLLQNHARTAALLVDRKNHCLKGALRLTGRLAHASCTTGHYNRRCAAACSADRCRRRFAIVALVVSGRRQSHAAAGCRGGGRRGRSRRLLLILLLLLDERVQRLDHKVRLLGVGHVEAHRTGAAADQLQHEHLRQAAIVAGRALHLERVQRLVVERAVAHDGGEAWYGVKWTRRKKTWSHDVESNHTNTHTIFYEKFAAYW